MKTLLILLSLIPMMSYAQIAGNDITCALKSSSVNNQTTSRNKAQMIANFTFLGNNVYEHFKFKSEKNGTSYRNLFAGGNGEVHRLQETREGLLSLGFRFRLDPKTLILTENTTGGGYPGAGAPPRRENQYQCLLNYAETDITKLDKKTIIKDLKL